MLLTLAALVFALPSMQEEQLVRVRLDSGLWRYELGHRVAAMERAFGEADEELRARSVDDVDRAVQQYFGGGMSAVAEAVDGARRKLVPLPIEDPAAYAIVDAQRAFGDRLALVPMQRLVATGSASIDFEVLRLYGDPASLENMHLWVSARTVDGNTHGGVAIEEGFELPRQGSIALEGVREGDHTLSMIVLERDLPMRSVRVGFSVVDDLDRRLARLHEKLGRRKDLAPTVAAHTSYHLLGLLDGLAEGRTLEVDYPAARLVREAETLAFGDEAKRTALLAAPGDRWLALPLEKGQSIGRLFVPSGITPGADVPIVFALHGAGGSENLFFEAYGDGLAVELARERGWILFAPRVGFLGYPLAESLDVLDTFLPIDRKHVFVVGHSMGAGAAVGAVAKSPAVVCAYAALGGGGTPTADMTRVPAYVAAGATDFGRPMVEALARELRRLGATDLEAHTFEHTEHLLIVQRALPDVFGFFDRHAAPAAAQDE